MNIGEDRDSPEITFAPLETDTPAPAEPVIEPASAPVEEPASEPVGV